MFQYFNLALYSNKHKFNIIHALNKFANRNKDLYYKKNSELQNKAYGFQMWWIRIADDKEVERNNVGSCVLF